MKSNLTVLLVAEGTKSNAKLVIDSFREFNDIDNLKMIVYDNSTDGEFREYVMKQEDFIFAYSEEGILPYGRVVMDSILQLGIDDDLLIVPDNHLLIPGTLGGMIDTLNSCDNVGAVGGNFNGNHKYGLGKDVLYNDYISLAEYANSLSPYAWELPCLDETGTILVRKELLNKLKERQGLVELDEKEFKQHICRIVYDSGFICLVDASHFWWNLKGIEETKNYDDNNTIFFTVGIPTYNRGHRALETVNHIIKERERYHMEDEIEILVSDNASDTNIEGYEEIDKLSSVIKNLVYWRSKENKRLLGNIHSIISKARGKFCMLLSDEDKVVFAGLILYIAYLRRHPEIAVMKGWSNQQYYWMRPIYQLKGVGAIDAFFLKGNYISGIIYNREVITGELIGEFTNRYDDTEHRNRAFLHYNHMFFDSYALLNGSFAGSDIPLVEEGESEFKNDNRLLLPYALPDERLVQAEGYIPLIRDLKVSDELAIRMFLLVFSKTLLLLQMVKSQYNEMGYDWNSILQDLNKTMKRLFYDIDLKIPELYHDTVFDSIERITKDHMD